MQDDFCKVTLCDHPTMHVLCGCKVNFTSHGHSHLASTKDMVNRVKNYAHCKKFEGAPPFAKVQKLPCSSPGEIFHIDFMTIEETVDLHEKPEI